QHTAPVAVRSPLAGDYNGDLTVDIKDYQTWKEDYATGTALRSDGNNDGLVDLADYTIWRNSRGHMSSAAAQLAASPELAGSLASRAPAQHLRVAETTASTTAESSPAHFPGLARRPDGEASTGSVYRISAMNLV